MGHPNLQHAFASFGLEVFDALKKLGMIAGADFGIAEFTLGTAFDLAAELLRHGLHAVADPRTGTPASKRLGSLGRCFPHRRSYGEPERMMPLGANSRMKSAETSFG